MNLWGKFRQHARIAALESALRLKVDADRELLRDLRECEQSLERERTKRIAAESVSEERHAEIDRLIVELSEVRAQFSALMGERLKSLDALNVKLMTERVEEKPPDMAQFKRSEGAAAQAMHTMQHIRKMNTDMDMALITKLHPKFQRFAKEKPAADGPAGVPMNVPVEAQG